MSNIPIPGEDMHSGENDSSFSLHLEQCCITKYKCEQNVITYIGPLSLFDVSNYYT